MNRFQSLLCFGLLIIILLNDAQGLSKESIVGGIPAEKCEIKYQVALVNQDGQLCGGSIVSDSHVITTAACVYNSTSRHSRGPIKVTAGTHQLWSDADFGIDSLVDRIYVLDQFQLEKKYAGIAVLRLATSLNVNDHPCLQILTLPKLFDESTYANETALVSGYGLDNFHVTFDEKLKLINGGTSQKLNLLNTTVLSNKECQVKYSSPSLYFGNKLNIIIHDKLLCAQANKPDSNKEKGICRGDEGGPLVFNNTLIGVLNSGLTTCNEITTPALYTRVSPFSNFINRALNNEETNNVIREKDLDVYLFEESIFLGRLGAKLSNNGRGSLLLSSKIQKSFRYEK